jgi:hypothetical protein
MPPANMCRAGDLTGYTCVRALFGATDVPRTIDLARHDGLSRLTANEANETNLWLVLTLAFGACLCLQSLCCPPNQP